MSQESVTQKIGYSFLKILTGSDLSSRRLPLMKATTSEPSPVIWLTGCGHGDEVGGVIIIQEIFKRLRKEPLLRGTLCAFPLMNPLGFETTSRTIGLSKEDLNRSFPGNKNGSPAERIAEKIFTVIRDTNPELVLDLHNDWRQSVPYVVIDPDPGIKHRKAHSKARAYSKKTGLLIVCESKTNGDSIVWERTLSGSLLLHDIPALTLELGEAYVVNEQYVRYGVTSIWNILTHLGMTKPLAQPFHYSLPGEFQGKFLQYSHQPVSSSSGILRFLSKPGDRVAAEQPVAKIYNAFGKLLETIKAQKDGIVLGYSDSSVSFPGVPIMAFGILEQNSISISE